MKTKHTPGPWRATRLENQVPYGTVDWLVEHQEPRSNQPNQPSPWWRTIARLQTDDDETRANARLIALAPELADVIMECAEFARGSAPIYPGSELANSILTLAAKLDQ